jgi:hypothetical protein
MRWICTVVTSPIMTMQVMLVASATFAFMPRGFIMILALSDEAVRPMLLLGFSYQYAAQASIC